MPPIICPTFAMRLPDCSVIFFEVSYFGFASSVCAAAGAAAGAAVPSLNAMFAGLTAET